MTNRPHERGPSRLPTTWDEFLALAPGDPFRVVLCDVPLDDEDPVEPEAENPPRPSVQTGRTRGRPVAQVRGILADQVVVSSPLDPFLSLKALASYSGISVRTLRQYLELPPNEALPCYRLPGKILVRVSEFNQWIEQYRSRGRPSLTCAMRDLGLIAT